MTDQSISPGIKQAIGQNSSQRNGKWAWLMESRGLWLQLFGLWLVVVCLQLFVKRDAIPVMDFSDPDDAFRMVQVRDYLAGQSWFDVTQYRSFAPMGAPMHWSRLVDLPIAGVILLLRPFVGEYWAEVAAAVVVPLLTSALLFASMFWAMKSTLGEKASLFCCAALAASPMILFQFAPLRIDHHGWQIVMAALVLGGVLHRDARLGGLVAGLAMAVSLRISSEGLPLAALTGGVLTLRYAMDRAEWPRLSRYIWSMVLLSAALLLITQGWPGAGEAHCDSLSTVYLLPLACVPVIMSAGRGLLGEDSPLRCGIPVGVGAGAAAVVFLLTERQCLAGPFSSMNPQVYEFWYKGVLEGLPVWMQSPEMTAIIIGPSLVGLVGAVLALMIEKDADLRRNWLCILILGVGTALLSLVVMRAMCVAHLMTLPGAAWLMLTLHKRIEQFGSPVARVPAMASLVLLAPVGSSGIPATLLSDKTLEETAVEKEKHISLTPVEIATLNNVSPAILFAPFDVGPDILQRTHHSVIATAHHRNLKGMEIVISAFLVPPEQARGLVQHSTADYVLVVPDINETNRYTKYAPNGLAAQLVAGHVPNWLTPVPVPGAKLLRLYRIERPKAPVSAKAADRNSGQPATR